MKNARRYDKRITIGSVPTGEDLVQLKELGYKTIVDVRDEEEKFGGLVRKKTFELGMSYISIPVTREAITLKDVDTFFQTVYAKKSAPLYAFSRFGKRPLAFLLLFEAVAKGDPLIKIFRQAARFGLNLEGDLCLHSFLVEFYNEGYMALVIRSIQELRPDLLELDE